MKYLLCTLGIITVLTSLLFIENTNTLAENATQIVEYAGVNTDVPLPKIDDQNTPDAKINHILYKAIKILLSIAGFVAVTIIVVGGVTYTISADNDDMTGRAKNIILYALAGLLVIIFSYAIFTNVVNFLEASETTQ